MKLSPVVLALLTASSPALALEARIGSWSVNDAPDPITGARRVFVQASSSAQPGAFLQVRCFDARPLVVVTAPRSRFGDGARRWVVLRFGDMPAVVVPMAGIKGTNVLGAPLGRDTYRALASASSAAVRVIETDGSTADATYALAGTSEAFRPVLELCPSDSALDRPAALYDPARALPPEPPAAAPPQR